MTTTPTDLDNLDHLLEEYASAHVEYWTSEDDSPFEADAKKRREEAAAAIREQLANVEKELAKTRAELDAAQTRINRTRAELTNPMWRGLLDDDVAKLVDEIVALLHAEANPATTAEPAAEPKVTVPADCPCHWMTQYEGETLGLVTRLAKVDQRCPHHGSKPRHDAEPAAS